MLSILYLLLFLAGGVWIARMLLPGRRPLVRLYIGLSLGVLLLMWLPVLWAYGVCFSNTAHWLAAGTLLALCAISWLLRDRTPAKPMDAKEERLALDLLWMVVPLTILSGFLQYTHSIRPMADGSYYVGQSTYGDLSLHLAVTTSIVNAKFPLENSLMLGATMAYPYLADSIATTMLMLGQSLPTAMAFTGTLMMTLVYMGYGLLVSQLCRKRGARFLAFFLLFLNGGLGFFYTISGRVENGYVTTVWDNLYNVMNGYYQTPTNQPDPNNLRWVNIICDMLIPQRGILGGWTMLMPCLNLLLPPLCRKQRHTFREMLVLGVMAGGMPLLHTHSFLALALTSAGACLYCICTAARDDVYALPEGDAAEPVAPFLPIEQKIKNPALRAFLPWLVFGATAAALSLPQLINFTFVQATNSNHFLRFQFNWCNNRGGNGLVDPYFWFYIKNIGLPYLLILFALLKRKPKDAETLPDNIRQNRLIACGAFLIYLIAELIIFQPNEYDNNKLLYVWFLLCLPMAADYAMEIYQRLKGLGGRRMIAAVFLITCFLSAGLTVIRECKSGYQAYSAKDVAVGEYIRDNTPEHSVFITGNQHLNPVSSLAGRTILCSSDSYLYYHGFDTNSRRREVAAFYENPSDNLSLLRKYGVDYIYISSYERNANWFTLNEGAVEQLFPLVYESAGSEHRIFQVPEEMKQ
ncbi:MAG: hypothetical protein IKC28_06075 [Clostridia bacterium]|nr:hypothetical protein [Clostridia bacterium]